MRAFLESLRAHQWAKNLLLAVPAVAAWVWMQPEVLRQLAFAFVAFSLAASGNYLINDLLDVEADRNHPGKRQRPLASGRLNARVAWLAGPALILAGIGLGMATESSEFSRLLGAYVAVALAYSFVLKRLLVVDVIVLAALYALRLLAGGAAVEVQVSSWLLAFFMFLFLSLAFAKRLMGLTATASTDGTVTAFRAYVPQDREAFASAGMASGLLSILVLALTITSEPIRARYGRPDLLWLSCPLLLYWILRLWFLTLRGQLHHDPVAFAVRDWPSYGVIAGGLLILFLAAL